MKYYLPALFALCALMSCSRSNKAIQLRISDADSVAINYFKGDGTMDTVVAVKIIRDKQKIEKLADYVGKRSAKRNFKCGYDGSLHFFKMNQVVQDIDFRMNDADCMYFFFLQQGEFEATALSEDAKKLINSFRGK